MSFRQDFIWGAATASYQIEGAAYEDGKGLNVWDRFSHEPGKVLEGHTGDIACDHYHRFKEDVALMKKMGVKNYRFSLSWARLIPQGVEGLLLAGRCISGTHMAHSNYRVMPMCVAMGEAAGYAAALSVKQGKRVSEVAAADIQVLLV